MATWKRIPNYAAHEASTSGDIRVEKTGRILNPTTEADGRRRIVLVNDQGKRTNRTVAALVLATFKGPPPEGKDRAIHRDGVMANDKLTNLKWGSYLDQVAEAKARDPNAYRNNNPNKPKLTAAVVREAMRNIKGSKGVPGTSLRTEAARLHVSRSTLTNAIHQVKRLRAVPAA